GPTVHSNTTWTGLHCIWICCRPLCKNLKSSRWVIHAPGDTAGTTSERSFGLLPHQIRGSISQYNLLTLLGYASSRCVACSNAVLSEYRSRGLDFVMQAINEPTYLEDLTGLTDLMKCTDISQVEWVDEVKDDEFADI
uniref:Uncharacterized protein n=1 Tax=Aegilops tauschii subsp. strangulata TaxID=200361 RepID=A0A453BZ83_AEGTS